MKAWCYRCGVDGTPEKAVGVDEDGEPACALHRAKEIGAGLNAAAASRTAVPAPIQLGNIQFGKAFEAAQIKPAATPSPVQTKTEETKAMSERICKGFNRACGNELGELNRTGMCITCYARKKYHDRKAAKGATDTAVESPKKARKAKAHTRSGEAQATFGVNHFSEKQMDRFWSLLSPVSKAEAIDRLLSYQAL